MGGDRVEFGSNSREIVVRSPQFDFSALPRLWFRGNTFLTFFCNGLNLTFPAGERCFVHAVRQCLPGLNDQALREQIRRFSAQEGQHARSHERLIAALREQGFELSGFFDRLEPVVQRMKRRPVAMQIALTAALEHFTALLAEISFTTPVLEGVYEPVRKLIVWHCAEELEHRAVAFDVMRAVGVGYPTRLVGFVLATIEVLRWTALGMVLFARQSRTPWRVVWHDYHEARRLIGKVQLIPRALGYLRPSFHPSQHGSLDVGLAQLRSDGLDLPKPRGGLAARSGA
jgi:uncharacterized protein